LEIGYHCLIKSRVGLTTLCNIAYVTIIATIGKSWVYSRIQTEYQVFFF